jgi:N4-gp56 family major capsid protein
MTAKYDVLTAEQRTFFETVMLARAQPGLTYIGIAQKGVSDETSLPENSGDTISWRLLAAFPAVTTSLTEGDPGASQGLSISAVTATVEEYGAYVRYTKKLAKFGIDRVASEASEALGEQAGDSLDQLVRDVVVGGSAVQYASTAAQRTDITTSMKLTAAEIMEGLSTLKTQKARPLADGFYAGIIHPLTEYDMYQDTTIQAMLHYARDRGASNPWVTGYIGDAFGVRWYVTANAKRWVNGGNSNADVFGTLLIGKGSFGIGGLAGEMPGAVPAPTTNSIENNTTGESVRPVRLIDKPFGSAGSSDPMDQNASLAWWTTFTTARLREVFMLRIEHATALGT